MEEAKRKNAKYSNYPSDRKRTLGIETDDNPFHIPKRKVKNKSNSMLDYTKFKSNFRWKQH